MGCRISKAALAEISAQVDHAQTDAGDSKEYTGPEALLESVASGAIAPLKGSWVVALRRRGGRLQRRQDLPPEAHWSAAELRDLTTKLGDDFGVLFVALSYRWLTKDHPDPEAFHLRIVAEVAALYLNMAGKGEYESQLTAAFQSRGLGSPDFALFWDFAALYQKPRTEAQKPLFLPGLRASNIWYGHARSVCWMQSELPEGFAEQMRATTPPLAETYEDSGWCFVEAAISAAIKPGFQRLDLAKRTQQAIECAYGPEKPGNPDYKLACVCARRRPPPPSPERVAELLRTAKKFTNASDVSKVAQLYATFFESVTQVKSLVFKGVEWGDADIAELVTVLPRFARLTSLDVSDNKVSAEGGKALAEMVKVNTTALKSIDLSDNNLTNRGRDMSGIQALADAIKSGSTTLTECTLIKNDLNIGSAKMLAKIGTEKRIMLSGMQRDQTSADFSHENLRPADAIMIASDLPFMTTLTECTLIRNNLDVESAKMLAKIGTEKRIMLSGMMRNQTEADFFAQSLKPADAILIVSDLPFMTTMKKVVLSYNRFYDEGAIAIAGSLKTNSTLETLELRGCNIGPAGGAAIAESLQSGITSLTSLSLYYNSIGPDGAAAIADALKLNTALTTIDLRHNDLDAASKRTLTDASERRATPLDLEL